MNQSLKWDVIVVGGGPAGMTAAARAAERGKRVLLLEKNAVLGKKLIITGGGRCNVTNAVTDRHVLTGRYGDKGVHLHSLFARFGPDDTCALLRRFGLETKVEAEGRVFPVTESAYDVRAVLEEFIRVSGVTVRRGCAVVALVHEQSAASIDVSNTVSGAPQDTLRRVAGVRTARGEILRARAIILATGGSARPETGSTGDAFPWLRELGVTVRSVESALVPLKVPDAWVRDAQGLALPDAELIVEQLTGVTKPVETIFDRSLWGNARRVLVRRGKLLFTHFGLSGPLALNAAADIRAVARNAPIRLVVNPLPGRDPAELDSAVAAAATASGKRTIGNLLRDVVPPRIATAVCAIAAVPPDTRLAVLSRASRRSIVSALVALPCSFAGLMGQDKAVVSSGGVDPAAVDFRTMRLRTVENLYVLGDLLDFNRRSGGYSLQVCWASGWVAGEAV